VSEKLTTQHSAWRLLACRSPRRSDLSGFLRPRRHSRGQVRDALLLRQRCRSGSSDPRHHDISRMLRRSIIRSVSLRWYESGPVTSSVSGNDVYCTRFRIFTLSCCAWSVLVRWRPSPSAVVVTQLVTQAAFLSGIIRRRGSQPEKRKVGSSTLPLTTSL
jgi:hypothetical protein